MYSEKQVRQILHEKNQQIQFHIRQREIHGKELNKDFIELLNRDIILLETILEESAWQKLMGQIKKEKWYHSIFCNHEWKWKERAYTMFKQCSKCGKIK